MHSPTRGETRFCQYSSSSAAAHSFPPAASLPTRHSQTWTESSVSPRKQRSMPGVWSLTRVPPDLDGVPFRGRFGVGCLVDREEIG
jgi:hypothetical protein